MRGDDYRDTTHHQRPVKGFQSGYRGVRIRAQHNAVRPVEVFNRAAFGKEQRMRDNRDLPARCFESFFNAARRAHWHRGYQDQDLTVVAVIGDFHGDRFHVAVGIFRQVNNLRALHHGLQMG